MFFSSGSDGAFFSGGDGFITNTVKESLISDNLVDKHLSRKYHLRIIISDTKRDFNRPISTNWCFSMSHST